MQEFVLRNWSIVRIGTTAIQKLLFFQLSRLKNKIQDASFDNDSLEPINNKIAKEMKINVSEVEKISQRVLKKDLFLDHSLNNDDDDNRTPLDFLSNASENPDQIALNNDINDNRKKVIKKSLDVLNDKEKHIILKRHLNHTPLTL